MVLLTNLYLLCGIVYVIVGLFAFFNDSKSKLNRLFSVVCMDLAYWSFMTCLMNGSIDAKTASTFYLYSTVSWSTFYCIFLHYIIILTNREGVFKKKLAYIILYFPALVSIYLYVLQPETAQNFVKSNLGWVYIASTNKGFLWTNFYNAYYLFYMMAVLFCLFKWWKNSLIIRERKQAMLI